MYVQTSVLPDIITAAVGQDVILCMEGSNISTEQYDMLY